MRSILKSSFVWQFAGGFLLGAVGLFSLQPGDQVGIIADQFASTPLFAR